MEQKILVIVTILVTFSILHYLFISSGNADGSEAVIETKNNLQDPLYTEFLLEKLKKSKKSDDRIDGKNRFDWYKKEWQDRNKDQKLKKTPQISLLHAYEYDFEISVSYTTPGIQGSIVYCRYFDINGSEIGSAVESFTFPDFIIYCPKRDGVEKMSISVEEKGPYEYLLPLEDRLEKDFEHELSMCMSSIYGEEAKWLMLSELIEHYKLQGVTKFYFYVHSITEYDTVILEDYVRTGEVEVHYLLERDAREHLHWQMVTFRDCTLRNKMVSKWSIFADIDERLLMTDYPGTILDYLRDVKDPKIGGIQFRQQWIMKTEFMPETYENETQISKWMPTLRWHNSSAIGPPGHTVKTIIDPLKTVAMWTHYPRLMYPGYHIHGLDPKEGIVRHYRDLKMWNWGNTWLKEILKFGNMSMTNYPEKYQKKLEENVQKRVKYVYKNYKVD